MASTPAFRTVLRGYEPAQVDQRTAELLAEVRARREEAARLREEVEGLRRERAQQPRREPDASEPRAATPPAFHELGARVGQILTMADEEAHEMVVRAGDECSAMRAEVEASARVRRAEADRYDATVRADAGLEAQRLVDAARRRSEETLDAAHHDALARREEGEALWEEHRARAAQAAADFEMTLATRRERAQADFHSRAAAAEHHLDSVERAAAHARAQSERELDEATAHVRALLDESHAESERLVAEARERAERIRADSERELTAASQRRDSINAQMTHVRHMLASMSGSVPILGLEESDEEQRAAALEANGLREVDGRLVLDSEEGHDGWEGPVDAEVVEDGAQGPDDHGDHDDHEREHEQGHGDVEEVDLRDADAEGGVVLDPQEGHAAAPER